MSDTPETDATANPLWGEAQEVCLLRELARKLERERDEARAQYQTTHLLAEALAKTQIELKAERDEARDVARWLYQHGMATLLEGAHRNEWIKEERK